MKRPAGSFLRGRYLLVVAILLVIIAAIIARVIYLGAVDRAFLQARGKHQSIRYHQVSASRGIITDRNGVPVAISAPIANVVLDPHRLGQQGPETWHQLAQLPVLDLTYNQIKQLVAHDSSSRYHVVAVNIPPEAADRITNLHIPGAYIEHKKRSYYPLGKAAAQLLGFTNHQDVGQSGLELGLNNQLQAIPGKQQVLTTALGQPLQITAKHPMPHQGKTTKLSIDSRIQYFAYQALKHQVKKTHSNSGSVVVLDPKTGEVLAATSYPSFNPNSFASRSGPDVRNRAITDQFEPGSVIKVLTLAAALASGQYTPDTEVDTTPGRYYIHGHVVRDDGNYGKLTVTGVLTKSSNVGASKIGLSLPRKQVYDMFVKAGIGKSPTSEFPGAARGVLHPLDQIGKFTFATMTFGYATSLSVLQLAHIYAGIANKGVMMPITFTKADQQQRGTTLMPAKVAKQLLQMLHTVVLPGGTGILANIPGYKVAGKTGTAHKVGPHGFYKNRFNAVFVGMVPYQNPRLVIAVRMDNPRGHFNGFGGVSAAPVFASIAARSMQALGVAPTTDKINQHVFRSQEALLRAIAQA